MTTDLFSQYPESSFLSLVLQNPDVLDDVKMISPFMLSSSPNRNLYESVLDIYKNGIKPEYGLIIAKLQEKGKLLECGGEAYVKFLSSQEAKEENIKEYVEYILNSYKSRQILSLSSSIPRMVNDVSNIESVIGNIRNTLDELLINSDTEISTMDTAVNEAWVDLVSKVNNPDKIELSTGIKKLDAVTGGYWSDDLWVVAGRPGMGKTSYMCNSVITGQPSLIFSLEMSRKSLIYRFASILSGVPVFNIRLGQVSQSELDRVAEALKVLKELPIYINTDFIVSIEGVVATIRKYKKLYDVKSVHIDYLQLLAERTINQTSELGQITRTLKLLVRDIKTPIVMYSQLNRGVESREDKRPLLSDLRQSGNIEEDVDVALFLYRDNMYNPDTKLKNTLELLIRKQRNGPTGVVTALFDEQTNKIVEED